MQQPNNEQDCGTYLGLSQSFDPNTGHGWAETRTANPPNCQFGNRGDRNERIPAPHAYNALVFDEDNLSTDLAVLQSFQTGYQNFSFTYPSAPYPLDVGFIGPPMPRILAAEEALGRGYGHGTAMTNLGLSSTTPVSWPSLPGVVSPVFGAALPYMQFLLLPPQSGLAVPLQLDELLVGGTPSIASMVAAPAFGSAQQAPVNNFSCKYGCSQNFTRASDVDRHSRSFHRINQGTYLCTVVGCVKGQDGGYSRADKLKEHMWKKHANLGYLKGRV